MRLILSGGGDPEGVVSLDELFAEQVDVDKPVLYVPVAWETANPDYEAGLKWFKRTYNPYGITDIEMCTDLCFIGGLERYTAVFIGGGNTFKLLKEIKESNFDEKLIDYLQNGGLVYGGSAGAIICGKTIRTAAHLDHNDVGLTDLSGLNLAGGKDILCHYNRSRDDELIRKYDGGLYVLYEESGLFITDNGVTGIGKAFKTNFDIYLK